MRLYPTVKIDKLDKYEEEYIKDTSTFYAISNNINITGIGITKNQNNNDFIVTHALTKNYFNITDRVIPHYGKLIDFISFKNENLLYHNINSTITYEKIEPYKILTKLNVNYINDKRIIFN
jgi:hypothetical protein